MPRIKDTDNHGPLSVTFAKGHIDIRLCDEPKAAPWPLNFEMDVAEAMDEIMFAHPRVKVRLIGWKPTRATCSFIYHKMLLYEVIWKQHGWYALAGAMK